MKIRELQESDFEAVMSLADTVFGKTYIDLLALRTVFTRTDKCGIISSFILEDGDSILGFRLTYAPETWCSEDKYTVSKWGVPVEKVCYFKTASLRSDLRGQGWGKKLLDRSIEASKAQGALAGVADIWLMSPNNSAYRYFSKAGGEVVNIHQARWAGNYCSTCGGDCNCPAAEMILHFGSSNVTRND